MAIVSVAAPRSVQNGNALDITLELKQVNFVNTSTLLMKNPVVKKTAKKSNLGTQTPQQVQPFQGAIDWVVSFGKSVLGVK
jgi:hypothetical protein